MENQLTVTVKLRAEFTSQFLDAWRSGILDNVLDGESRVQDLIPHAGDTQPQPIKLAKGRCNDTKFRILHQRTSAARLEGKNEPRRTRMLTDKEGLGCTRRANGAEKQQTSCKQACGVSIFLRQSRFAGVLHAAQAICE